MPLPSNMSEFEHLQDVIMRVYNLLVRDNFNNNILDDDINTPESALLHACKIKDKDSGLMMLNRMMLFMFIRGGVDLVDKIYGVPMIDHHLSVKFAPQIILKFKETKQSAKANNRQRNPVRLRTSFRLLGVNEKTVTDAQIDSWAVKLKQLFPSTYYHTIAMGGWGYIDKEIGLNLYIRSQFKPDAVQLIDKIIEAKEYIRVHSTNNSWNDPITYKAKCLKKHEPEIDTPSIQTLKFTGLNETYKLPTGFKGERVYLTRAELHLHGRLINKLLIHRYV